MTIGPGDSQAEIDARKAAWAAKMANRVARNAEKQSRKDTAKAHRDNKPVTWGELRPLLIDAGILDP